MKFAAIVLVVLSVGISSPPAEAGDSILLNFSSPHCGPCRSMEPTLQQLERAGIPIRHIDVSAEQDLATRYGIRSTPTFVVISGGREVTRLVGAQSLAELRRAVAASPSGPLIPTRSVEPRRRPNEEQFVSNLRRPRSQPGNSPPGGPQTTGLIRGEANRSEAMPSVSLADAVQRAQAATVRLRVHDGHGYGAGTGTIIDTHGDDALVLTCGHLFRENSGQGKIEVDLFIRGETKTVLGRLVDYDADTRDIALVEIRPGFPVQPVQVVGKDVRVESGFTAFSFGCDRGADPSRRDTRITGVNKYNQHLGVSNLEIAGAPIDGRSGGGLFDDSGRLIGVCNAADYKSDVGIYAGPGSVHWQLDRVGLANVYNQPLGQPVQPNADRIASLADANDPMAAAANRSANEPQRPLVKPASFDQSAFNQPAVGRGADPYPEVIVIVRDRNNPDATSRVMTLDQPSAELMQMIQRQSR